MSSVFDEVRELFNDLIESNGSGGDHCDIFSVLNRDKYWNDFEPYLKYRNIQDNSVWNDYYLMLAEPQEYEQAIYIYDIYGNLVIYLVLWNIKDCPEICSNSPYIVMEFKKTDGVKLYVTNKFDRPPTYNLNNDIIDEDSYYNFVKEISQRIPTQFPILDNLIIENKLWYNIYTKPPHVQDKLFFVRKTDIDNNLINCVIS